MPSHTFSLAPTQLKIKDMQMELLLDDWKDVYQVNIGVSDGPLSILEEE